MLEYPDSPPAYNTVYPSNATDQSGFIRGPYSVYSRGMLVLGDNETLGDDPRVLTCPNCLVNQMSIVQRETGRKNLIVVLCFFSILVATMMFIVPFICLPLLIIPLYIDKFKHTEHICPSCNHLIGINK